MLGILIAILSFVFVFGVVVFVHELGHFIAAKLTGVYAPKFSIGFGPGPRKRWGETQYILGVIPLGGYVRMASREDEATAFLEGGSEESAARRIEEGEAARPADWDPDAMIPFGPKPVPANRWFESKSLPQRLLILVAGVTMNTLLAFVIYTGMAWVKGRTTAETRVVGAVHDVEMAGPLRTALLPGDTIRAIQGEPVENWDDIVQAITTARGDSLRFTTQRGDAVVVAGGRRGPRRQMYVAAIEPFVPPVLGTVVQEQPAGRAGLQVGDSIVAAAGQPVLSFSDVVARVSASPGRPVELQLVRQGATHSVTLEPTPTAVERAGGRGVDTLGRIGVAPRMPVRHEPLNFVAAVGEGVHTTWEAAGTIFAFLEGLVRREVSMNQLGGPIEIARQSARAARQGLDVLFAWLALISINLAVLNLLPIPVLDGGQIVLQVAESVKGSPFSNRTRQAILGTGVVLVLLLMLVASYNDILRFFD